MNFPFFIARRYIFAKKSTHAINIISAISAIGVAVATMALVIVLSVFNGFHDLVASLFTNFDPQLKVVPVEGKTVPADDPILTEIKALPQVDVATESVEDQALAIYQDKQAMVMVKGVDDNFSELTHITDILYGDGTFSLHAANLRNGMDFCEFMLHRRKDSLICPILMQALWSTRSIAQVCCSLLSSRSMTRIISSPLLPLPVICLDSKVCCPHWRFA